MLNEATKIDHSQKEVKGFFTKHLVQPYKLTGLDISTKANRLTKL